MHISKILALLIAALIILTSLTSCRDEIVTPSITERTYDVEALIPDNVVDTPPMSVVPSHVGELYGSYLTMYLGHTPSEYRGLPYIKLLKNYSEVEEYYNSTMESFLYGARFTIAMASFTDDYLADKDVLIAAINEPSSYVNHTAEPVEITDDEVKLKIIRHIPEACPKQDTQYHLVFTAPKGSFDGIDQKKLSLDISEVVDPENSSAFDAERFRIFYPEYWNFCYRADAVTDTPEVAVAAIGSYEELTTYFFDKYSADYDLDSNFKPVVGTLYNWEVFERYFIIATIIPVSDEKTEPITSELFVNNLEIYITVDAKLPKAGKKPKACYLLLTAIEKSDLEGVDLSRVNLSV